VSRLGVKILREIVIAVSMQSRIFKVRGYERELQELWQHALATAAYNKEIARMRRQNVEVAFLCGLLHDVGKPVVLQCLTDLQRELGCELTSPGIFAALEAYHTQAGEQLASRWALPAEVCASIAYHHDYYITPTYFEAVRMTYLADCLSYTLMQPEPDIPALRQDAVWADLNFYPDDIEALLAKHETVVRFVEGMV
jgi:putative nucleotidyltransferase with HDIG domain